MLHCSQRTHQLHGKLMFVDSVMCFQLHNGPLPLWRCSVLWGETGNRDAGWRVLHGWDELRPTFKVLFLWRQHRVAIQKVARQGQRLLDKVLGQIELLGHRIYHTQTGLVVWEELPEQTPVLLCELLTYVLILSLLFLLFFQSIAPVLVRAVL